MGNMSNIVSSKTKYNMKQLLFLLLPTALLFGCSKSIYWNSFNTDTYTIEVDAYGEESNFNGKKCYISLADSSINPSDLQFQEFRNYLSKVLSEKGYKIVDQLNEADVFVNFDYGISGPNEKQYKNTEPIIGPTGISASTTTEELHISADSTKIIRNITTSNTPIYGVTGYKTDEYTNTTYKRYVNIRAYDYHNFVKNYQEKRLWQAAISSSGTSDDLRKVFPYMLVGAKKYLGTSSGEKKELTIYENSLGVMLLKGQ